MTWPWRKHLPDVEAAKKAAEEAKEAAEKAKENWPAVQREVKRNRELRQANGWTEALTDIFGGKA